jgi:hypothetical protein
MTDIYLKITEEMEYGIGTRVEHYNFGRGTIVDNGSEHYTIWFKNLSMTKSISKEFSGFKILELVENQGEIQEMVTLADVELALENVLNRKADLQSIVPLGNKWEGGTLIMKPGETNLQSKEVPIETFFHKIVMVRDRVRVMEQQINAHKVLTDEQKVDLQQYITRIYGSLTTFNVLFKNESDHFKGAGA